MFEIFRFGVFYVDTLIKMIVSMKQSIISKQTFGNTKKTMWNVDATNAETFLLTVNKLGLKYSQLCGHFPFSFYCNEASKREILVPKKTWLLIHMLFLIFFSISWLVLFITSELLAGCELTTSHLGDVIWSLISMGGFTITRIKSFYWDKKIYSLWQNLNTIHKDLQQYLFHTETNSSYLNKWSKISTYFQHRTIYYVILTILIFIFGGILMQIILPALSYYKHIPDVSPLQNLINMLWITLVIFNAGNGFLILVFMKCITTSFENLYDSLVNHYEYSGAKNIKFIKVENAEKKGNKVPLDMDNKLLELIRIFKRLEILVDDFNAMFSFDLSVSMCATILQVLLSSFNLIAGGEGTAVDWILASAIMSGDVWEYANQGDQMTRWAQKVTEMFEEISFSSLHSDVQNKVKICWISRSE